MFKSSVDKNDPGREPDTTRMPVVEAFFQSHDVSHFAEQAEWVDTAQNLTARGRAEIAAAILQWYAGDFLQAYDEPLNLIETDDTVVAEWVFHGLPRNKSAAEITIPMIGVFEVFEQTIQRLRLYYDRSVRYFERG